MIYILGLLTLILISVTVWCIVKVGNTDRYTYREVDEEQEDFYNQAIDTEFDLCIIDTVP